MFYFKLAIGNPVKSFQRKFIFPRYCITTILLHSNSIFRIYSSSYLVLLILDLTTVSETSKHPVKGAIYFIQNVYFTNEIPLRYLMRFFGLTFPTDLVMLNNPWIDSMYCEEDTTSVPVVHSLNSFKAWPICAAS